MCEAWLGLWGSQTFIKESQTHLRQFGRTNTHTKGFKCPLFYRCKLSGNILWYELWGSARRNNKKYPSIYLANALFTLFTSLRPPSFSPVKTPCGSHSSPAFPVIPPSAPPSRWAVWMAQGHGVGIRTKFLVQYSVILSFFHKKKATFLVTDTIVSWPTTCPGIMWLSLTEANHPLPLTFSLWQRHRREGVRSSRACTKPRSTS